MIDHLLRFETEDAAKAAPVVGAYWMPGEGDEPGAWRGDVCIPGVSVYRVTGTETVTPDDGPPYEREVRESYSGWFITICGPLEEHPARHVLTDAWKAEPQFAR